MERIAPYPNHEELFLIFYICVQFPLKVLLDHIEFGLYISTHNPAFEPSDRDYTNNVRRKEMHK